MSIGILGTGTMGGAIARALARKNIDVLVANNRGPASLQQFARDAGPAVQPATVAEAASADIVVLAVPWLSVPGLLGALPPWENRILIDATNPVEFLTPDSPDAHDPTNPLAPMGLKAVDLGGRASTEIVAELASDARVVKTFNHVEPELIEERHAIGGKRVLYVAGDDPAARAEVAALLDRLDLFAVDLGALAVGGPFIAFPGGAFLLLDLVKP